MKRSLALLLALAFLSIVSAGITQITDDDAEIGDFTGSTASRNVGTAGDIDSQAQDYPLMFTTSAWGSPDLGSWPEAGGQSGTAAADAICQSLATIANLDNPATFHAWISDSTTDAYCRVLGLTGKKADDCGQETLPNAGPWLRTDGFPFSGTLQQLTSESMVLVPAQFDEQGNPVDGGWETITGTEEDGTWAVEEDCQGWTENQWLLSKFRGWRYGTVRDWASSGLSHCGVPGHLLCFEADSSADQLPEFEGSGAQAFVTSVSRFGNLGAWPQAGGAQGIEAGDAICRNLARSAGLQAPDSFVAWLSDSSVDAKDRLAFPGPWKRIDGVPIAADLPDLTDGTIFTSISVTEKGDYVWGGTWTGTYNSGDARNGETCADWTDENARGANGKAHHIYSWSNWDNQSCASFRSRLYCFSQVVHVPGHFADGFESGETFAWTNTVP